MSIFVFYVTTKTGKINPLGTAVAINCDSKKVLLTAGHCCFSDVLCKRRLRSNLFCTESMVKTSDGIFQVNAHSFPVKVLFASKIPDVGILCRTDLTIFSNPIPLCPRESIPWIADSSGWECRVKCYHCPVDVFRTSDFFMLSCNVTNYNSVAFVTEHHFAITEEFLGGSSGGAMILQHSHNLVGILISTLSTPTTLEDVDIEEVVNEESITCSVINPSITFTTAIVPSLLSFHVNGSLVNLSEFIRLNQY